jgi:hypothetical protein
MTPKEENAEKKAIEALIGAGLALPSANEELHEGEFKRYIDQRVTLNPEYEAALQASRPRLFAALKALLCDSKPDQTPAPVKHTKGIYYRRAAFDTYVICSLGFDPNLGRTKIEKINHLVEYHCGVDFEREPVRDAAGPVDYVSRRKVESLANKQGWYLVSRASDRPGVRYTLGRNRSKALEVAHRVLGNRKAQVDELIRLFAPLDTRTCEVVATLYAAWNDLILARRDCDESNILIEAREKWHPHKLMIPLPVWAGALQWMNERTLVPRGTGRPVRPSL